ncbi:HD domain-containing phosphohydrolase [Geobacter sp. DSM 9736]|uniref:HD domain-containing phosphohydrolase n=1 Tax=Geobacter sp. DSM 9736 TaxID=1277350 RepID=UPI000B5EBB2D|nr:HD domain-containing phosphohydrolase [Geobacter sp. DSM 9736]SNB47745.1 Response regulator c-di-GMP phosphodiesterase, RpfG family, contains REC and HD-GYP domains [Geobacter sp. DSM 9736]
MKYINNGMQLYNSRIIDNYIKLIKRNYSYINISELLKHAKMEAYEIADQGHWFTQEQVDLFHDKLAQATGNSNIAREAGRHAASPDASGVMRQYFLGLVGPAKAFEMLGNGAKNFTRSSHYESRVISSNKVEITVTPNLGIKEKPFQCENRLGTFEAILMLFNYNASKIEHTECMFNGSSHCKYVFTWDKSPVAFWNRLTFASIALVFISTIIALVIDPSFGISIVGPASLVFSLCMILITKHFSYKEVQAGLNNLRDSTDKLLEQININYNNALLSNEIGQALSTQTSIDKILSDIIQVLENRLDYDRGLILLANHDKTKLMFQTGFGYNKKFMSLLQKTTFHLDRPESTGVFIVAFREKKPFLINNVDDLEGTLSLRSLAYAKKLGSKSFICCPIICEDEPIGILAVDNLKSKRPLLQSDMSQLMGIAPMIGISIRNAQLIESKTRQFRSLLQVLAASIDARDSLTAGHSTAVTEYALGICDELAIPRDYRETVRVAALLHDYGKIGIPDSILKKEGKLTSEEFDIVKTHSSKTREILEQINFEGMLQKVPEIAGSHHEKIDGSGYPLGLKGNEIPLGAKIIAVADFFEAITSKRHYREPMPLDEALALLEGESGERFERKIVNAFISYYKRHYGSHSLHNLGRINS